MQENVPHGEKGGDGRGRCISAEFGPQRHCSDALGNADFHKIYASCELLHVLVGRSGR